MEAAKQEKTIVFLDTPGMCDRFANPDSGLIIAMTPAVSARMRCKNVSCGDTLPYFTDDSHRGLLERSAVILDWIRSAAVFEDIGPDVRQACLDSMVFWMRCSILYCLWNIEVVSNAIASHGPERVEAPYAKPVPVLSMYPETDEMTLGAIARKIAIRSGIRFEALSARSNRAVMGPISYWAACARSLSTCIAKEIRFKLWKRKIARPRSLPEGERPVFFTTQLYGMANLVRNISTDVESRPFYLMDGPAILSVDIPDFALRLLVPRLARSIILQKKTLKRLAVSIKEERNIFSYKGVYFGDIIAQKFLRNIAPQIAGQFLWAFELSDFLDLTSPYAFLSSGNRIDDLMLASLARGKGIPYVLVSHGSDRKPMNRYEMIEWGEQGKVLLNGPYSHVALQSPLAEGHLKEFPFSGAIIKTGPLLWGKPVDRSDSKRLSGKMFSSFDMTKTRVIVHAGTPKSSSSLRLYVYETPDEYIRALRDLACAVEKIRDTVLVVRFRPHREISAEDLKKLVPFSERVVLNIEDPFAAVLGMADLLVSFSSTTIEEALQNRIPVLLYGGYGRYVHVPAFEVKPGGLWQSSAVYHVGEASGLGYAINKILSEDRAGTSGAEDLFRPYIYEEAVRMPLSSILK